MNLMKLFNKKYFKENIKKSKGILAFFFCIIPIINFLFLMISSIFLKDSLELINFNSISMITYLGSFIIPIILAVSLFGFVFKQKSVDFIMSKPISRNSIYITNLIGGILLIGIFVIINALIYGMFSLFSTNLIIPFMMLIDYIVYWFVAYVFIFVVSSLAISIAGNLMGSIVLILLIICMYPFLTLTNIYYHETHNYNIYLKCETADCKKVNYDCKKNENCINHLEKNEYELEGQKVWEPVFTTPVSLGDLDTFSLYNSKMLIKTIILSLIYSVIGYYIFIKRKMENNETNFKNEKLHYIVKTLTFLPVSFICYLIIKSEASIGIIISLVISLIYYTIYDLITRKEIYKALESSAICVVTLGIFLGLFSLYDIYMNNKEIVLKDITDLEVMTDNSLDYIKINDKELLNSIIMDTLNTDFSKESSINYYIVKTNKGKYNFAFNISKENKAIIEEKGDKETKKYFDKYDYDKIIYVGSDIKVTKELKKLIKDTMQTTFDKIDYNNERILEVYTYKNHQFEKFNIYAGQNPDLDKYVMDIRNKKVIDVIESGENVHFYINDNTFKLFDYVINENKKSFLEYLRKNNSVITKNTLTVSMSFDGSKNLLIGDKKAFKAEFAKYEEKLKNNEEYQRLLKEINNEY